MCLLSKDRSCGKFLILVDFRVGLDFSPCSMELPDYHLIQEMLGKYREEAELCVDSGNLLVTLHSGSQSEIS